MRDMKNTASPRRRLRMPAAARALSFVVLFALIFLAVSAFFRPVNDEVIQYRRFFAQPRDTMDMVYVGGSVCFCSWAPYVAWRERGIASYSLASAGVTANAMKYMVLDAIDAQSPDVLLIDALPFQYTTEEGTSYTTRRLMDSMPMLSKNRAALIREMTPMFVDLRDDFMGRASLYADFLLYHNRWKNILRDVARGDYKAGNPAQTLGFKLVSSASRVEIRDSSSVTQTAPVPVNAEIALLETMRILKEKGISALFVVPPYDEPELERMKNNYVAQTVRAHGFQYINLNDFTNETGILAECDFYDKKHLNFTGGEKFTVFLSAYADELFALPDRREDAAYGAWNKGYEQWLEDARRTREALDACLAKARTGA